MSAQTERKRLREANVELEKLRNQVKAAKQLAKVLRRCGLNEFEDKDRIAALAVWRAAGR